MDGVQAALPPPRPPHTRLRSACNLCRQLKVRCSGGHPCQNCANSDSTCDYGISNRIGRPKGAKNRQSSKGRALAPAAPQSPPSAGSNPLWLSLPAAADKAAFSSQPWQAASVTPANQHHHQQYNPPHQHHHQQYQRPHDLEPPRWPTPPELLEAMPPMDLTDDDAQVALDDREAAVFSRTHSSSDLASFFGTGSRAIYGTPTPTPTPEREGWPLGMEMTMPPLLADDIARLLAAYDCGGSSSGGSSGDGDGEFRGDARMDSAPPSEHGSRTGAGAGAGAAAAVECSCLQRNMDLLCSLKRPQMQRSSGSNTPLQNGQYGSSSSSGQALSVDGVLQNAQEACDACRAVAECHDSLENHDHEVIVLLVMCLRTVVSQIQQLSWQASDGGQGSPGSLQDGSCSSGSGTYRRRDDSVRTRESSLSSSSLPENRVGVPIRVGEFEVCGDDKDLLLRSLRRIALRKLAAGLTMLRQLVERKKTKAKAINPGTHPPPPLLITGANGSRGVAAAPPMPMPMPADDLQDALNLNQMERMMDCLMNSINAVTNPRGLVEDRYLSL